MSRYLPDPNKQTNEPENYEGKREIQGTVLEGETALGVTKATSMAFRTEMTR